MVEYGFLLSAIAAVVAVGAEALGVDVFNLLTSGLAAFP